MASYKQPCMYCGKFIQTDAVACPYCGAADPMALRCPVCREEIEKDYIKCPSCGFSLRLACPACGKTTFAGETCEFCGASLMIECQRKKCGQKQPYTMEKCIRCGKPIKK